MAYLLIILSLLVSCSSRPRIIQIDPQLRPYYDRFVIESRAHGKNASISEIIIEFADLGTNSGLDGSFLNGVCIRQGSSAPTIEINSASISGYSWQDTDDTHKEMVMFHELGHCVLFRVHTTAETNVNNQVIPVSLMAPFLLDETIYSNNREYYLSELFL